MNLDEAIAKHAEWKTKFRKAIAGKEKLDAGTIARDDCCELGKWLHGEARARLGALLAYRDCLSNHAKFHTEAGKVASAINAGKYVEAEGMLAAGTTYSVASGAVGGALVRLKKEAAAV